MVSDTKDNFKSLINVIRSSKSKKKNYCFHEIVVL